MEKIKNENSYNHNVPTTTSLTMSAPPLISPSMMYSGPPPPYSYPSSAASSVIGSTASGPGAGRGNYISAPTTRSTSGDERDLPASQRQSLPSITEALTGEQQPISISSLLSTTAPPQKSSLVSKSPTSPIARSYLDSLPRGPPDSFPHQTPVSTYRPSEPSERTSRPMFSPNIATTPGESRFPAINSFTAMNSLDTYQSKYPPRTAPSPSNYTRPGVSPIQSSRAPPPVQDSVPHSAPPASNASFGYNATYPAPYSYALSTPNLSSYRPPVSLQQPSWRSINPEADRIEEIRKAVSKQSPPPRQSYGESVKRHLDIFDLESSLNDVSSPCYPSLQVSELTISKIANGSGRALEWTREYGTRAHQTQRSGPIPGSMPSLQECDEMIQEQEKTLQAMARIREVILKQHQALQEQKIYNQRNYKTPASEADDDNDSYMDKLDGQGDFAGSDAKKRRGRAAPPGRCHSCNRAETPEWRRGPDGARTLCNACGLREFFIKFERAIVG